MKTYTIFIGSIPFDECRAPSREEALQIAISRQPSTRPENIWVRLTR